MKTKTIHGRNGLREFQFCRGGVSSQPITAEKLREIEPGISDSDVKSTLAHLARCEHWVSGTYHVAIDKAAEHGFADMTVWHLSMKRHDRQPIGDWRTKQRIKSEVCGNDVEAFELYPAEDRVVDLANQYHLYAFPGISIPVGFGHGRRSDESSHGAVQRPGSGA